MGGDWHRQTLLIVWQAKEKMPQTGVPSSYVPQMLSLLDRRVRLDQKVRNSLSSCLLPANGALTCLAPLATVEKLSISSVVSVHKIPFSALWGYFKWMIDKFWYSICDFPEHTWDICFPSSSSPFSSRDVF